MAETGHSSKTGLNSQSGDDSNKMESRDTDNCEPSEKLDGQVLENKSDGEMKETSFILETDLKRKAEDDCTKIDLEDSKPPSKSAKYDETERTELKQENEEERIVNASMPEKKATVNVDGNDDEGEPPESAKFDESVSKREDATEMESDQPNENDVKLTKGVSDSAVESGVTMESTDGGDSKGQLEDLVMDPLGYTKAEEFTSEIFKIQIHQLPKFGYSDLKKRLISLGLKPHKFKSPRREVTYVCFRNEADRQEALKKINGHVWRGKKLEAREAAPQADPFLEKRRQRGNESSVVSAVHEPLTFEEAQKKLKNSVIPLWEMEYSKQLETKTEKIASVLKKLTHQQLVREQFRRMESWKQDGMPCPLLPIIPSPVTAEYRNKNEFTVGYCQDGKTIKVGFRYGLYKDGTTTVGDCTDIGVVKPVAVPILESFEKFVSQSKWLPYLQQTGTGHWVTLTVRAFDSGDVMAMADFHPRKLDKNEIAEAKDSIRDFYAGEGPGKDIGIKSFYFRLYAKGPASVPRLEKVFGEPYVYETLLGLKFRISPEAFFQVNTKATEKLYSSIGEWCGASLRSTVLDICCGTGTIGLSMAKKVKQVIGVEMCEPAVEDAKENASINDIHNVSYYCSKVEDVIGKVLASVYNTISTSTSSSSPRPTSSSQSESTPTTTTSSSSSSPTTTSTTTDNDVIAVVDPPRAGLHKSVIKMLRKSEGIRRLVYVSCNPENAMDNFVDLIRPSSGKLKGDPFTMEKAMPVDLFPGTKHCELVLLFTR